jgi:hypothetical protein
MRGRLQAENMQDPLAHSRLEESLELFEKDFLAPLEKDATFRLLSATRERNAQSLLW